MYAMQTKQNTIIFQPLFMFQNQLFSPCRPTIWLEIWRFSDGTVSFQSVTSGNTFKVSWQLIDRPFLTRGAAVYIGLSILSDFFFLSMISEHKISSFFLHFVLELTKKVSRNPFENVYIVNKTEQTFTKASYLDHIGQQITSPKLVYLAARWQRYRQNKTAASSKLPCVWNLSHLTVL